MIKVGINGFGRIGRFVFRAAQEKKRYSSRRYQ
jgi:glyceraldehyde-3-phosphate dehydrogenase/erythrose-4-phosphate dehydrogenase